MKQSGLALKAQINTLLQELHNTGRPRVWSIIVTLFGDAIVPRGGVVSLLSIQEIFSHMQFEQNAVRTAMSRLTKEGWLERKKSGRQSFYKLAAEGLGQFETATKRIYSGTDKSWSGEFDLVIMKSKNAKSRDKQKKEMFALGFGAPINDVFIRPSSDDALIAMKDVIARFKCRSVDDALLQGLVGESWQLDELQAGYKAILEKYGPVFNLLTQSHDANPMDALVLRILLVHDWRRVVLKDVDLPDELKPDNWVGVEARNMVGKLYHQLMVLSETQLDACFASAEKPLPQPDEEFYQRFKFS